MNKSTYQVSKEVALLLAGALFGALSMVFDIEILQNLTYLVILLVLLLLYGIGIVEWLRDSLYWVVKRINQKIGYICIYAPYEIKDKNSSWVETTMEELSSCLKDNKIRFRVDRTESIFNNYPIIVNPYGGSYPEKDFSTLESFGNVMRFVRTGGTYINIADIPFYFAYDEALKRRVDTTPLADGFSLERPFLKTLLTQKFNHYVWGIASGKDKDKGIERVIELTTTSINLFNKTSFDDGPQGEYSPVLKIPYGKGYFIFSTLRINKTNLKDNLMRLIKATRN